MKLLASIFCLLFSLQSPQVIQALTPDFSYCRINEGAVLYKTIPEEDQTSNALFNLTPTYFVEILNEENGFYKVNYSGINGFVKKESVTPVYETPKVPFPENITLEINNSLNAVVRSTPSSDGNYVGVLPYSAKVNFIGKTTGDEAILGLGTDWFFISYVDELNIAIKGYIYAPLTENLCEIPPNNEELSLTPVSSNEITISPELKDVKNLLVIGGLTLAGIILIITLFLPFRKTKKQQLVLERKKELPYNHRKKIDNNDFDF